MPLGVLNFCRKHWPPTRLRPSSTWIKPGGRCRSQFTSEAFTATLKAANVRISMDGKGRAASADRLDNILSSVYGGLSSMSIFTCTLTQKAGSWNKAYRTSLPSTTNLSASAASIIRPWHIAPLSRSSKLLSHQRIKWKNQSTNSFVIQLRDTDKGCSILIDLFC
jgi:hypothetical protein